MRDILANRPCFRQNRALGKLIPGVMIFALLCILCLSACGRKATLSPAAERYLENEEDYRIFDATYVPVNGLLERFSIPVNWSFPEQDNSTIFGMHSFRFLDTTALKWAGTFSPEEELIVSYIKDYLQYTYISDTQDIYYAWNDDSVARRVFRLSYWGYLFQEHFSEEELALLKETLSEQAYLLTQEDFYNKNHNHGMYQDMGLIAYALFWEEDEATKTEYLELAKNRSETYFDYVFTEEGIHKEHSPRYGYDIAACLLFYANVYQEFDAVFAETCEQLYQNCGDYFSALTMPDGYVPSIGDSPEFQIEPVQWPDNQEYQWVASGGNSGVCPPEDNIFPHSGYATLRSSWEDAADEATYLLFTAATYSSSHKHSDDLGFILYHKGDLFVEAGKKDYDYKDEQTRYTYSNYAHNVMLVNGEGFPVTYAESGAQRIGSGNMETACATQFTAYDLEADVQWVQGIQYRYAEATQLRTIAYDEPNAIVQITDSVEATVPLQAQFLYHIAPGVTVQEQDMGWILSRDDEVLANVYISSEAPVTLETTTNSSGTAPYYTTTYYETPSHPQDGSLLLLTVDCEKGDTEVNVVVELSPQAAPAASAPLRHIDWESPSAVYMDVLERPYGPYYISVEENEGTLSVENTYTMDGATYSWEIFAEDQTTRIANSKYTDSPVWNYTFEESGTYYIKAWIKDSQGEKLRTFSRPITVKK